MYLFINIIRNKSYCIKFRKSLQCFVEFKSLLIDNNIYKNDIREFCSNHSTSIPCTPYYYYNESNDIFMKITPNNNERASIVIVYINLLQNITVDNLIDGFIKFNIPFQYNDGYVIIDIIPIIHRDGNPIIIEIRNRQKLFNNIVNFILLIISLFTIYLLFKPKKFDKYMYKQ